MKAPCAQGPPQQAPARGELRILNQFTETFSVNELAERIRRVASALGMGTEIRHINNPRQELEDHYYNPAHRGLLELGLKPTLMTDSVIAQMLEQVRRYHAHIRSDRIYPRVSWNSKRAWCEGERDHAGAFDSHAAQAGVAALHADQNV